MENVKDNMDDEDNDTRKANRKDSGDDVDDKRVGSGLKESTAGKPRTTALFW